MTRTNPWFELDFEEDAGLEPAPASRPESWIERIAATRAFAVLFGIALLVTVPILLFGLVLGLPFLLMAVAADPEPAPLLVVAAVVGGAAGMLGLARAAYRPAAASATALRLTVGMLAIGVVTALCLAVAVAWLAAVEIGSSPAALFPIGFCAILAVLSVKGIAEILHLRRLERERAAVGATTPGLDPSNDCAGARAGRGEPRDRDALPWIFLGAALLQALAVVVINVSLA